ncbi:MAG: hypothetical protein AAB387_03310, partial [candidate division NC10 bacterium]
EPRMAFFPFPGEAETPRDFGVPFEAITIDTKDGERLRAWKMTPPAPLAARARIVYFHGNGGNLSNWSPILAGVATALVFGYSYGAISTLFPAVVGDLFGRSQAGALVGFLFAVAGAMAGWGPLIAGAIYDATGGYALTWGFAAAMNLVALVLLALSRPPRVD